MRSTVTAVICAYTTDRWDQLVEAVESVHAEGVGEIAVVIDHCQPLLELARDRWPTGVTILENTGRQGLSSARNTALDHVDTDLIAFLDDDARAQPGWIDPLLEALSSPDVVAAGGAADPVWPGPAPAVIPVELRWIVGCTFRGQPESQADVRNIMGCSMLFRTAPLRAIGGFNPDTGRVGRHPVGCEETEACIRLRRDVPGARVVFEPRSRVAHRVSPDRTRWAYVAHRSYCEGLSKAALARTLGAQDSLSSESDYLRRTIPGALWREAGRVGRGGATAMVGIVTSVLCAGWGFLRGRWMTTVPGAAMQATHAATESR